MRPIPAGTDESFLHVPLHNLLLRGERAAGAMSGCVAAADGLPHSPLQKLSLHVAARGAVPRGPPPHPLAGARLARRPQRPADGNRDGDAQWRAFAGAAGPGRPERPLDGAGFSRYLPGALGPHAPVPSLASDWAADFDDFAGRRSPGLAARDDAVLRDARAGSVGKGRPGGDLHRDAPLPSADIQGALMDLEDDEFSHEWSNETLTEQARIAQGDVSPFWAPQARPAEAASPWRLPAHLHAPAPIHLHPFNPSPFARPSDPTYIHLTNSLLERLEIRAKEAADASSLPDGGPSDLDAAWERALGMLAFRGPQPEASAPERRTCAAWDEGLALAEEADRGSGGLRTDGGSGGDRTRLFVAGDWDWERVFGLKGPVEPPEQHDALGAALRRMQRILAQFRGLAPTKADGEGPEGLRLSFQAFLAEAAAREAGDLRSLHVASARLETMPAADEIGRRWSPESFDSVS
ncbi:hypothetical protein DFJ74DRAFT_769184 [Hyaloraphidium curvatum]|nr:hypothetical protein DFJ74DRAFT_769184 [Hyaloraphidium curvatum]